MASYEIEVSQTAEKQIRKLAHEPQLRILRAIQNLAQDPRPPGCRKLKGYDDVFRIRVGMFRVIYSVEDRRITVVILKVGNRRQVYR